MVANSKQSSKDVSHLAAETLNNPKRLGDSEKFSRFCTVPSRDKNQTGADMEAKASAALKNPRSSDITKTLAGSVVSQSNKKR
ncbi:hypothetical protein CKQ90_01565 [Klebsiella pneumoniae]|nr:hypothetical protein CKQ90_01565 [Klebsiella pneumoniae]